MAHRDGIVLSKTVEVNKLISAFCYNVPSDFAYPGEQHDGWEFVYVESGKICETVGTSKYIIKSGEMVCHKPFEFHCLEPYQGSPTIIVVCFKSDSAFMKCFNNMIISISKRQKEYLNDIIKVSQNLLIPKDPLDIVRDGCMQRSEGSKAELEQEIKNSLELLILSLTASASTEKEKRAESFSLYSHRQTLTEDIKSYINENLENSISLSDISDEFSYSKSTIKRIFKAETGKSVISYLLDKRLKKAKELLQDHSLSIGEITSRLGFSSVYYFSRFFKERTGQSPTKYRSENAHSIIKQ